MSSVRCIVIVGADTDLALELAEAVETIELEAGSVLIAQNRTMMAFEPSFPSSKISVKPTVTNVAFISTPRPC